jgi:hypothetical protein
MARLVFFLIGLIFKFIGSPAGAWVETEVLGRIPAAPFLQLSPAGTTIGRSLTMSSLLAGALGLAFYLSLTVGTWLLVVALLGVGVLAVGFGRAIGSYWWPFALTGALLGLALCLSVLPELSPWAPEIEVESQPAIVLMVGGLVVLGLALWSSVVTVGALRRFSELRQKP